MEQIDSFIANVGERIINPLIILLFSLALVFFLYGVFQYIMNGENEEERTQGRNHMIWGVIGLTVMMGVWTILKIVMSTLNINGINPEQGTVQLRDYNP